VMADTGGRYQPTALRLDRSARATALWTRRGGGGGSSSSDDFEHGQVEFTPRGLFCIHAGRSDLADPSHFTIEYELDDRSGTIDGYLRPDERVELVPRAGWIVDRDAHGREATWDPTVNPPTSAPAGQAVSASGSGG